MYARWVITANGTVGLYENELAPELYDPEHNLEISRTEPSTWIRFTAFRKYSTKSSAVSTSRARRIH